MPRGEKELRLGLVCYGGSSLSIYMHGITKEIHRLVKASALRAANQGGTTPSEGVYADLLAQLSKGDAPELRVLVDVIAGTSAGGINGIFLAKAVAQNRSQEWLLDLWLEHGDMNELVRGPRKIGWKWRILPVLAVSRLKRSPLRGTDMAHWIRDALDKMDGKAPEPATMKSLLPPDHRLDLVVTITDFYGYQRLIPLSRPPFVADNRHRHSLGFRYESSGADHFGDNAGLAFAARTTSSIPAVFPPVSLREFGKTIGSDLAELRKRCFRIYELNGTSEDATYFVDGGVLDNKPFRWAIDTIVGRRPAGNEVDRRLIYIEPDPGGRATKQGGSDPTTLGAGIGALTTIRGAEPILDDLLVVQEHNDTVERIRDVIETNFGLVTACVGKHVTPEQLADTEPAAWPWDDWEKAVAGEAAKEAGMTHATYLRLRTSSVVDGFARSVWAICNYPEESNHAQLVREAVRAWARAGGLFGTPDRDQQPAACDPDSVPPVQAAVDETMERQTEFLRAFDLGFMRRRLRFAIAGFNWWYSCVGVAGFPSREDLDKAKAIVYDAIATLDALAGIRVRGDDADAHAKRVRDLVQDAFGEAKLAPFLTEKKGLDVKGYTDAHRADLDKLLAEAAQFLGARLDPLAPELLGRLTVVTRHWTEARRRDLVVRYLGFAIWDVLLYPLQTLTHIGEQDHVDVVRMSPKESTMLPTADGKPVEGVQVSHFYAFFERTARENDYLRGRLDAAEQLIGLLLDTSESQSRDLHNTWAKAAFEAIMREDADALPHISNKVEQLKKQIAALPA